MLAQAHPKTSAMQGIYGESLSDVVVIQSKNNTDNGNKADVGLS